MDFEYIVVQAGGKGTRLQYLTENKPKALVPIENLPMIFHLFHKFPNKRYLIIGDYKIDVLREYLKAFASVKYIIVDASGNIGTCAGIEKAISFIPEKTPFMLIWSDLILSNEFHIPEKTENYLGLSVGFECRWKYENGVFEENPSKDFGVAGLFLFKDKSFLKKVPKDGELVKWFRNENKKFDTINLYGTKEFGLLLEYNKLHYQKCRPFNKMAIKEDRVRKEGIDTQGKQLAIREKNWYRYIKDLGFQQIPQIYSFEPFEMERIKGKNIYDYTDLPSKEKQLILENIINSLKKLHSLENIETDYFSVWEAYIYKTYGRLNKIRDLVPFGQDQFININGRKCRNIFYYKKELEQKVEQYQPKNFCLLHGDCTFSNIMLKEDITPIFIDPRGYFGFQELYGDPVYDWAKLYYSLKGNYDQFNLKRFRLHIKEKEVELKIESNGWENLEDTFFTLIGENNRKIIKLFHALIWLSLTTYAWEDYDSICGAFYNGLYYLEEVL